MTRIARVFNENIKNKRPTLISYISAGDPNIEGTYSLIRTMEKAGTDIIELGIAYSDPLADGPVIQRASMRALEKGINIDIVLDMVGEIRTFTQIPLIPLVYYNSLYSYGIEKFLKKGKEMGIDGIIIPDLPLEEREEIQDLSKKYKIDLIALVTPTSNGRIKDLVESSSGFIYCVSSTGVTGIRENFDIGLKTFVGQIKKYTHLPVAIGFGISSPEIARKLSKFCDGIIVGSALIRQIEIGLKDDSYIEKVGKFTENLRKALDAKEEENVRL